MSRIKIFAIIVLSLLLFSPLLGQELPEVTKRLKEQYFDVNYYQAKTGIGYYQVKNYFNDTTYFYTREGKLFFAGKYSKDYKISLYSGFMPVRIGDKWGYMDMEGNMAIQAEYDSAEAFMDGVATVTRGNEKLLITPPKKDGGLNVVSSVSFGEKQSDVDINIPETKQVRDNTFAVIIANQNYNGFNLSYAINDGQTIKKYFNKTLGIPESNIIYYEDATFNTMRGIVERVHDIAEVYDGEACFIFYYRGQGATNGENRYIMPVDASLELITQTSYNAEQLINEIETLQTSGTLIFIDADFNKATSVQKPSTIKIKTSPPKGNIVIFEAAKEAEESHVYDGNVHSLFTYSFCKKMKETQGVVSLNELGEYLTSWVSNKAAETGKTTQTPQMIIGTDTNLKNFML